MCCGNLKIYVYLWWDGVSFFGPDYTKLARLSGTPPRWYDKYKSFAWLFPRLFLLAVVGYVVGSELSDLGSVKSQTLSEIHNKEYHFDVANHLPVIFTTSFNKTEIMDLYNKQAGF
jgi:hypothetical protein